MKKLITLLLTAVMLLSLAACSENSGNNSNNNNDNNDNNEPTQSQVSKNDEGETPPVEEDNNSETPPAQDEKDENEITFQKTVVVDHAKCSITVTDITYDWFWGMTLNVQLENKADETTYMFSLKSLVINGVECPSLFATEVSPGKKANSQIVLLDETLKENNIGDYTDIELTFRVYDSNDWSADDIVHETVHVYPYGKDKATKYVREAQPGDQVLVDNAYVTVIVTGYSYDEIWGYEVELFLVNKTDKTVMFAVDDASINDIMMDPFYATTVSPGKCAFSTMTWFTNSLEENGITDVEKIEFNLRTYDADDWFSDDFSNDQITLNP